MGPWPHPGLRGRHCVATGPSPAFSPCLNAEAARLGWEGSDQEAASCRCFACRLPAFPSTPPTPRASRPPPLNSRQGWGQLSEKQSQGHGQTAAGASTEVLAGVSGPPPPAPGPCPTGGAAFKETGGKPHALPPKKGELSRGKPGACCASSLTLGNGVHLGGFLRAPGVPPEQSVRVLKTNAIPSTHLPDVSQLQGHHWPMADHSGNRGSLLCSSLLGVTATGAPKPASFEAPAEWSREGGRNALHHPSVLCPTHLPTPGRREA